jgi:hypothetical protein
VEGFENGYNTEAIGMNLETDLLRVNFGQSTDEVF